MDSIFERLKRSNHLPQLPQVMLKLVSACGSDSTDVGELTRIISTDPALTSKLLQIISSPYVNLPKQVNTIKTAVVYLGLDTIRNIAISSSAMHFFRMARSLPAFDITRFWFHSYTCGVLARRLAEERGEPDPDALFLAGLLHDVGRLVLMKTFPKEYTGVLAEADRGKRLCEAEMERFKVDAPQVSAWLFNRWRLNPLTADAVLFVNEPFDKILRELSHVKILYGANLLAEEDPGISPDEIGRLFDVSGLRIDEIKAKAEEEVLEMARHLGVAAPEQGAADRNIGLAIKDMSVFFGTLSALVSANRIPDILNAVQKGLEIVFQVPRAFFFLLDREGRVMTGTCHPEDRHHNLVRSIAIPLDNPSSLVAGAAAGREMKNSFSHQKNPAVSDAQILRLMGSRGLYCIPIVAREKALGTMVLGVDRTLAERLDRNAGILRLFSNQTGICIESVLLHETWAGDISEKKMEAYAALTDKVVHEVNNPIAIVKNYLESLRLKLPDRHPAQEELSLVTEEISRVSSLLTGLSSFSKPRIGGLERININETCARIMAVLEKSILLPRNIRSRVDADRRIPDLKMDGNGLKQVVINLVKNAAEAMENGGEIIVSTALVPGSSKVMIDENKKIPGWVSIRIQDNGPGIPKHIRERLFEPYNTSKNGNNSGLGLAIVHSVVKEMKGRITCDSRNGSGTCFSISFPMDPTIVYDGGPDRDPAA